MYYFQVRGSSYQLPNLVAIGHSWAIWHLVDLGWLLHDLRPHQCTTLRSGVLPTKFGSHRAFLCSFTSGVPFVDPGWPCKSFDPNKAFLFIQGFFLPNKVAIGYSWAIWPLVDRAWPLTPAIHYSSVRGSSTYIQTFSSIDIIKKFNWPIVYKYAPSIFTI